MPDGAILGGERLDESSALDAERAVLGGLMMNAKNLDRVVDVVRPEHFSYPVHARIFAEQIRLIRDGGVGDPLTLDDWFRSDPDTQAVGGRSYLLGLSGACPAPVGLKAYAKAVVECWERRQVIAATHDLQEIARDRQTDVRSAVSGILRELDDALTDGVERKAVSLDEAARGALAAADKAQERKGPAGISVGFPAIDEQLGGLDVGTLTILAARPGMGKTALALQMAVCVAKQGFGVCFISLEMSADELGRRVISMRSGVPVSIMKNGRQSVTQAGAMVRAGAELRDLPLLIEDTPGLTSSKIEARVRQASRKQKIGLVVVDHLHIVQHEAADIRAGATWAVGQVSGAMKRLAKTHQCAVLLLAQLNRGVEGRDDKRPEMRDLRQSGDIEQDADAIAFIYREEYYLKQTAAKQGERESDTVYHARVQHHEEAIQAAAGQAELIVAKVRDGAVGTVALTFHGPTTSFGPNNIFGEYSE